MGQMDLVVQETPEILVGQVGLEVQVPLEDLVGPRGPGGPKYTQVDQMAILVVFTHYFTDLQT